MNNVQVDHITRSGTCEALHQRQGYGTCVLVALLTGGRHIHGHIKTHVDVPHVKYIHARPDSS